MTQRKSFFTSWLWDFWLRIFGKKYETKAGGKSPSTHNWRECPRCGKYIWAISFDRSPERCGHCDTILGFVKATEFCSCGTAAQMACTDAYCENCEKELPPLVIEFKDGKGRKFILLKPLYNPLVILWSVLTIASIVFLVCFYRFVEIPTGFTNKMLDTIVWVLIMFNVLIITIISLKYSGDMTIDIPIKAIFMMLVAMMIMMPIYADITVIPIWREMPTEENWKLKQETVLDNMQPGIERFEVATRIKDFNARPYFVEAARIDFVGLMQEHSDFVQKLDPYYGAQFYALVQEYLESLDFDALAVQCRDSQNIIYTPMSVTRFSSNIDACSVFLH